jgi:hypothetical protein
MGEWTFVILYKSVRKDERGLQVAWLTNSRIRKQLLETESSRRYKGMKKACD